MLYRPLGASGLKVSAIGLGSWLTIGTVVGERDSRKLVSHAFAQGINLFDTADVYNHGEGERALGAAVRDLPRSRLVIATKCFFPMSDDPNDCGLSRKHIHESLAASLRRLGTDYVDLYQCHRSDPDTPLLETALAMDDLIRRGSVLYWGTSQWPAEQLTAVVDLCRAEGLHRPISNQPLYNLLDRGIEAAVLPTSRRLGLGQLVYSPLAQGVLTGKYVPGRAPPAGSRAAEAKVNHFISRYLGEGALQRTQQLVALAARLRRTAAQIALAYCLAREGVSSLLVGAREPEQLSQNLTALDVVLEPDVLAELERLFPA